MYNQVHKFFYLSSIILLLSTIAIVGCKSNHEEKNEETTVVEDQQPSEWKVFKENAEQSINRNDEKIKVLEERISKSSTPNLDKVRQKRIDGLKEENARLRNKIVEYKEDEVKSNYEEFKANLQKELDSLEMSLNDFGDKFDSK